MNYSRYCSAIRYYYFSLNFYVQFTSFLPSLSCWRICSLTSHSVERLEHAHAYQTVACETELFGTSVRGPSGHAIQDLKGKQKLSCSLSRTNIFFLIQEVFKIKYENDIILAGNNVETTSIQRWSNVLTVVDSMSWRWINVESRLFRRCVPAGMLLMISSFYTRKDLLYIFLVFSVFVAFSDYRVLR